MSQPECVQAEASHETACVTTAEGGAAIISLSKPHPLDVLDEIEHRLAAIPRVEQAIAVMDQTDALRKLVRHAVKGFVAPNRCCYIKLLAQHRAGVLLAEIPKAPIGGARSGRGEKHLHTKGECLGELGIAPQTAWRWEQLSTLPMALITQEWQNSDAKGEELTESRLHALVRERRAAARDSRSPKRAAHLREEQTTWAAYDWLRKNVSEYFSPGSVSQRKLALILEDRTHVRREDIQRLRTQFLELHQRVQAACVAINERMEVPMNVPLLESIMTDEQRLRLKENMRVSFKRRVGQRTLLD